MSMHPLHLELFPPAHQETLGCSADLLLMCVDSPRAASCVQAPLCTRVAMLPLRALVLSGPFGAVFCIPWELGNCKLLEALLPSPRDCGVPASLCHFGLKSCPGQVPRAGWGPHQLPHPQAQPRLCPLPSNAAHQLECASPAPSAIPAGLACPPRPLPLPLISLSSGPTPPGSLPCCPRCQFLSLRGPRVQAGSVCLSLPAPVEYLGWSQLYPVRPRLPWGLVLHQTQLSMVPSLGSEGPGCGTSISSPHSLLQPLSFSRPVLCKVSAGDKRLTCTRP